VNLARGPLTRLADLFLREMDALTRSLATRVREAVDDAGAVLAAPRPSNGVLLTRLADLGRANWFRGAEVVLDAHASAGPLLPSAAARWPRQLRVAVVAADLSLAYATLRERARQWPSLVHATDWELQHRRGAARVAAVAASLGGLLIKAGQIASARPDLVPAAYVEQLAALQDRVPPRPWHVIAPEIARALGRPPAEVFESIDPAPIAAASLSQVHRARLRDGRAVALKIQYPDVAFMVAADLEALQSIVDALGRLEAGRPLGTIVDTLRATLPRELDFQQEGRSMAILRGALAHRDDVVIPAPVEELTSERLLVMELVEGIKITDREALDAASIDLTVVARRLNEIYAEQILVAGVLHGDPHPGNLLVQPGPRLVLFDHGLTLPIPDEMRRLLGAIVRGQARGDLDAMRTALRGAGVRIDEGTDLNGLLTLMSLVTGHRPTGFVGDPKGAMAVSLGRLPVELILVGRALGLLHGITRQLDPTLDVLEVVASHAARAAAS